MAAPLNPPTSSSHAWPKLATPAVWTSPSWGSAIALGVVCTGLGMVMYYRLIAGIGASRASTVTYLIPVFGVAWAWMLLGEPLTLSMALSGLLILGSVAMSQKAA